MSAGIVGEPPRRRLRPWHIVLIAVAALALFVGTLFFFVMSLTGPIVAGGDRFMNALKAGDFEQAYAASTPSLQRELGSPERFAAQIDRFRPTEWSWSHRALSNGAGELRGTVTFGGGEARGRVELRLAEVGEDWRVSAFRFTPG